MTRTTTAIVSILTLSALMATSMSAYESSLAVGRTVVSAAPIINQKRQRRGWRVRNLFLLPFKPLVRWSKNTLLRGSRNGSHTKNVDTNLPRHPAPAIQRNDENNNNKNKATIKRFVDTIHSPIGKMVLRRLFAPTDVNRDGAVDAHELQSALDHLNIHGIDAKSIVQQADRNGSGGLDLDEWLSEAPRTLRALL